MKAHEKVVNALAIDRERSLINVAAKDALTLCRNRHEASNSIHKDEDSEDTTDEDDGAKRNSLKAKIQKVMHINHFMRMRHSVRAADVAKTFANRLDRRRCGKFNDFLGKVLGDESLMAKTTELLFSLNIPLTEERKQEELLNLLVSAGSIVLHRAKTYTTQICWERYLEPMEEQLAELKEKYDNLKARFSECRDSYLKEVAALRDHVRVRGDPEAGLPTLDVVYLLDPVQLLMPGELKFLLNATTEKLKMILERNPKAEKCFDFGQLERLKELTEHHELHELRVCLQKETTKVRKLQEENCELRSKKPGELETQRVGGKAQFLISALEDQVVDLQTKLGKARGDHQKTLEQVTSLQSENDALAETVQELSCNRLLRERDANEMEEQIEKLQAASKKAETDAESNRALLTAKDDEIHNLKKLLENRDEELQLAMASLGRAPNESIQVKNEVVTVSMDQNQRRGRGCTLDVAANSTQCASTESQLSADLDATGMQGAGEKTRLRSPSTAKSEVETSMQEAMRSRDAALQRCRQVEGENADLRETLRKHMENLVDMKAEVMLDNSNDIAEEAKALGCLRVDPSASSDLRVCTCGNVLVHDATYCRKCGSRWQDKPTTKETETLIALASMHHELETRTSEGTSRLKVLLEKKDGNGNKQAWVSEAIETQNELAKLQNEKSQLEARLLLARLNDASTSELLNDDTTCKCSCAQKVVALRKLLSRTQGLCMESTVKLQRAATESYNLNRTLDKVQKSLAKAAVAARSPHGHIADLSCTGGTEEGDSSEVVKDKAGVSDDAKVEACLSAMEEARINSVFNRLYNNAEDSETRARRKAKRARLLQDTFRAVYQLADDADLRAASESPIGTQESEIEQEVSDGLLTLQGRTIQRAERPRPQAVALAPLTPPRSIAVTSIGICGPMSARGSNTPTRRRHSAVDSVVVGRGNSRRPLPAIEKDLQRFGPTASRLSSSASSASRKRAASLDLGRQ